MDGNADRPLAKPGPGTDAAPTARRHPIAVYLLIFFFVLPLIAVRLGWLMAGRWIQRRWGRFVYDHVLRLPADGAKPLVVNCDTPADFKPTGEQLRSWIAGMRGERTAKRSSARWARWAWEARRDIGWLYEQADDRLFARVGKIAHDPPRSPFVHEERGRQFLMCTNRSFRAWSFLLEPMTDAEVLQVDIPMGYTTLWRLEQLRLFCSAGSGPLAWPDLIWERAMSVQPQRDLDIFVLKDPRFTKHREVTALRTVVAQCRSEDEALEVAEGFTARYRINTCVARLLTRLDWH